MTTAHPVHRLAVYADGFDCGIECTVFDLAADPERLDLPRGALVTASALLDLVSEQWLTALARVCLHAEAIVSCALTYDGRVRFAPADPDDAWLLDLFNRHQLTDKGFGPALGPAAAEAAGRVFGQLGYCVCSERSDWQIGRAAIEMQSALIDGCFGAASEILPAGESRLKSWRDRRRAHVAAGRSTLVVGHRDLIAWPASLSDS